VLRRGWLTRTIVLIPYNRVQAIVVSAGPWQRARGLASVNVMSTMGPVVALAGHLDAADVTSLLVDQVPLIDQPPDAR
jgi:putative membrane protein